MKTAIILFGHGSREPRWLDPFERLAVLLRKKQPRVEVRLAFLELIAPDLPGAANKLIADGIEAIRIVPIFIGEGGHVRSDLPALVQALRREHPGVQIECMLAVGENDAVLEALAAYCLGGLGTP